MPTNFSDHSGRRWTVDVTVAAIKRVRGATTLDLLDLAGGKVLERLWSDPVLLGDVLYAVCQQQAREHGVDEASFGELLAGDTIARATDALIDSLVSFTPDPRERAALARVVAQVRTQLEQARSRMERELPSRLEPAALPAAMAGTSSGAAPESPA